MSRRGWVLLAVLVVLVGGAVGVARAIGRSAGGAEAATVPTPWQAAGGGAAAGTTGPAASPTGAGHGAGASASRTTHTPDPLSGQTMVTEPPVVVTTQDAPVNVTFYGWDPTHQVVQVGGYVTGVIESGGTCTLTLTKDGRSVTGNSQARPDATTTSCGAITVPGAQLSGGSWQAVLSYRSADHAGAAAAVPIQVTL